MVPDTGRSVTTDASARRSARLRRQSHGQPVRVDQLVIHELREPLLERGLVVHGAPLEVRLHTKGVCERARGEGGIAQLEERE